MKHQIVDLKSSSGSKGEADECLFEYLHSEIVNYVLSTSTNSEVGVLDFKIIYNMNNEYLIKSMVDNKHSEIYF